MPTTAKKNWTPEEVRHEFVRILDQGTTGLKMVVDAYQANRTPERDLNWICLQAGKEFGAITLQYARAADAVNSESGVDTVTEWAHAIEEEVEHYHGYVKILRTIADASGVPLPRMYDYVRVADVKSGQVILHPEMIDASRLWPENMGYFNKSLDYMAASPVWGRRAIGSQFEGGAVGWHWAMSQLKPADAFTKAVAELEKSIVDDELHHGPEEIKPLIDSFDADVAGIVDQIFDKIRELRYLELRQRNEQFLHPLPEAEVVAIGRQIMDDTLEPVDLFASAMGAGVGGA
jgi:hypothetical protein